MRLLLAILIAGFSWNASGQGAAQALDDQEVVNIENLYKQNKSPAPVDKKEVQVLQEEKKAKTATPAGRENGQGRVKSLTDLNKLAPLSDISVIQKKYLPKTGRFQLYTAGGLTTNSPWFLNLGAKINFGYNFTESFGLELSGLFLTNTERQAAKDIRDNNSLQPEKFIVTKNNVGIDLVWSPIYGKITNLDDNIIPFEMYFSLGAGSSSTNSQEGNVPNVHLGTGQIFALSKSTAFRWDYSWNYYQATPVADATSTSAPQKNSYSDLIFTAGVSFFFPEASYR